MTPVMKRFSLSPFFNAAACKPRVTPVPCTDFLVVTAAPDRLSAHYSLGLGLGNNWLWSRL